MLAIPFAPGASPIDHNGGLSSETSPASTVTADLPLLSVERPSVRFGSFHALGSADLRVEPGQVVAIAGENGAGKSTLVRRIAGDMPPTSGACVQSRHGRERSGSTDTAIQMQRN